MLWHVVLIGKKDRILPLFVGKKKLVGVNNGFEDSQVTMTVLLLGNSD
jgi:hypothetical protein